MTASHGGGATAASTATASANATGSTNGYTPTTNTCFTGYRVDHRVTDPETALGADGKTDASYRATSRAIAETRAALGLESTHDRGRELGY